MGNKTTPVMGNKTTPVMGNSSTPSTVTANTNTGAYLTSTILRRNLQRKQPRGPR